MGEDDGTRGGGARIRELLCPVAGRAEWNVIAEYGKIISKLCFAWGSYTNNAN